MPAGRNAYRLEPAAKSRSSIKNIWDGKSLNGDLASPEIFGAGDGATALDLPPGFEPVVLREGGDAFLYAQEIAARRGAGTLVFVQRFDLVEFAVVLEPAEPLKARARLLRLHERDGGFARRPLPARAAGALRLA